jgi:hypothetical protein
VEAHCDVHLRLVSENELQTLVAVNCLPASPWLCSQTTHQLAGWELVVWVVWEEETGADVR